MADDRIGKREGNRALGENSARSISSPSRRLSDRLALRPKELAAALGVGERTVRALLPEIPHFRVGGVVLIPVKPAERWLEDQVKAEQGRADSVAQEILKMVARDND